MAQAHLPVRDTAADTPPSFLLHQWVAAGIVSSAARFIPIPFVDDFVRGQCRRFVVARTLAAHGISIPLEHVKPYYAIGDGFFSRVGGKMVKVPIKLLLFPIRKTVAIATSLRGVPLEIIRTVLLGRSLDRTIRRGGIVGDRSTAPAAAARMRGAFDEAFARMDFHVVRAAIRDALSGVNGLTEAAVASARHLADRRAAPDETLDAEPAVDAGATRVQQVLDRPEMLKLFAQFDRRFDQAYERHQAMG